MIYFIVENALFKRIRYTLIYSFYLILFITLYSINQFVF